MRVLLSSWQLTIASLLHCIISRLASPFLHFSTSLLTNGASWNVSCDLYKNRHNSEYTLTGCYSFGTYPNNLSGVALKLTPTSVFFQLSAPPRGNCSSPSRRVRSVKTKMSEMKDYITHNALRQIVSHYMVIYKQHSVIVLLGNNNTTFNMENSFIKINKRM